MQKSAEVIDSAGPRPGRKARGFGHLRRAEILQAAERIFVECGYEGATIRRIADAVGVSSTALYLHFRDKNEILAEICEAAFQELLVRDTALMQRDMDPVERMRAMLEVYMDFALRHPHAYQLIYSSTPAAVGFQKPDPLQSLGPKVYELFRQGVRLAAESGRLKPLGVDVLAQLAWASAHGIVSLMLSLSDFAWEDRERLTDGALDALFEGIAR